VVVALDQVRVLVADQVVVATEAPHTQAVLVLQDKVLLAVQVLAEELLAVDQAVAAELVRLVQMDLMSL
jgi:hypothetical protein